MTLDAQSLNLNARQILLKRLSTAQALAYTGPLGEVIIDTNLKLLRVQDGVTPGGFVMATSSNIAYLQSQINSILNNVDPAALDSLSEVVANVNALLANNTESQLVNSGFYANLSNTGNLTIDGSFLPKDHLVQDLGSPTQAWRNLYISSSTAYFGNAAVSVTSNGLTVSMAGNVLPVIANVRFPDGTTQRTAVDMAVLGNIYALLTPNVSANLNIIHNDISNATSHFGNIANAAVSTAQANLQAQIDYIKTNIDPAALDSLTEIVASFQNMDANTIANIGTLKSTNGRLSTTLSDLGTLQTTALLPTTFTATVDSDHYVGEGSLTLTGDAWYFEIEFVVAANGSVETVITNNTPWLDNPGYANDMPFEFTEADHGIPGYTFTLTLVSIQNPGPMMWTTNLAASIPPTFPATLTATTPIKLKAGNSNLVLGTNGSVTLPGTLYVDNTTLSGSIVGNDGINITSPNAGQVYMAWQKGTVESPYTEVPPGRLDAINSGISLGWGGVIVEVNRAEDGGYWTFKPDQQLKMPPGGDIVDSNGNSVLGMSPFDQDLNTTDNPQFNRVGLTAGEINVVPGTDFNLYVTPDSETVHSLTLDTNGLLTLSGGLSTNQNGITIRGAGVYTLEETDGGVVLGSQYDAYISTQNSDPDPTPGNEAWLWRFAQDGSLTLPGSRAVLGWGGAGDTNSLNIDIPESTDPNVTHQFAFDASYGFPALRFPDGTFQTTALKTDTVAQTGYRLQFDTDIYANSTGGASGANETGVQLASNAVVRELFDLTPPATSTAARAYVDPEAAEFQPDPNILEVTIVSGAPLSVGMSVYAIVDGTAVLLGYIDSQTDATTFRLGGAPLTEEVPIGTEFEFYGPGNFIEYAPINPITIFWGSGEETVVTAGSTNNPYGVNVFLVTAEDQTALTYPIEVVTDNYAPAAFSHIIDADNGFKITTRADDFIINSNEGPLVFRNIGGDLVLNANGQLETPGSVTLGGQTYTNSGIIWQNGPGAVINNNDIEGYFVIQTNSTVIGARQNWTFGYNGVLTLPGEGVIRSNNDTVILQSYDPAFNVGKGIRIGTNGHVFFELGDDPAYFQIGENSGDASLTAGVNLNIVAGGSSSPKTWEFGTDSSLTLPDNGVVSAGGSGGLTLGGNFDVKIVADYTDNDRTWSFNGGDGSLTFPDSTVQETAWAGGRVVAVPTTSLGAVGDKTGDLAFNGSYIYYCTANYDGTITTIPWTSVGNYLGSPVYVQANVADGGLLSTGTLQITNCAVSGVTGQTVPVNNYELVSGTTYKFYITLSGFESTYQNSELQVIAGGNIWKRVAWSGDTW